MVVALSALAGGALAHAAAGGESPAPAAASDLREGAPAGAEGKHRPKTATPEPITPPETVRDAHGASAPSPAPGPSPRPYDPMGTSYADGRVMTGAAEQRLILFTFDDGPDRRYTPRLLDILDEHGIRAVFFMTAGQIRPDSPWGRRQAELAREVARRGHLIGNHTVDHLQLPLLDNDSVLSQLTDSERIFERVFGARPWLMRPPGGARSERVDALVEGRGYTQMLWNLGTGDFQVRTPQEVLDTWKAVAERRERENGERGGIVLLHDIHEWSVEAVPLLVREIRRRNCRLLAEGEELYDIVDDPAPFFTRTGEGSSPGAAAPPARFAPEEHARRQARLRTEARGYCEDGSLVASNR